MQEQDFLIYKDVKLRTLSDPLEGYLRKVKLPHKLFIPNTASSRGYYSKWAIDNRKLFLIDWQGFILNHQKVELEYLFPDEEFVFAKWFTGNIRIFLGEKFHFIEGHYKTLYEGEMIMKFKKGELVNENIKWLTEDEVKKIRLWNKIEDNFPI